VQVYGLDLSNDASIMLEWNHYFEKKSMRKLNIFQLNGVWQLSRPDDQDEEDDEDLPFLEEHVQGGLPQPSLCTNVNPNLGRDSKYSGK